MGLGITLTPAAFDRISRAVRWVEANMGLAGGAGSRGMPPPLSVEPDVARVTSGTADGDGNYPAVITYWDDVSETWEDYEQAVVVKPINGETLTDETRYAVRAIGYDASDVPLYAILDTPGGGGSGISFAEADGSPSYTGVTALTVDQADGLTLSQPGGAGTARLDVAAATTSQAGVVSTADQSFNGVKFFDDGLIGSPSAGNYCLRAQIGGTGTAATSEILGAYLSSSGGIFDGNLAAVKTAGTDYTLLRLRHDGTNAEVGFLAAGHTGEVGLRIEAGGTERTGVSADRHMFFELTSGLVTAVANSGDGVPASASATGTEGSMAYDASYLYICTSADTWRRIAHATW